MNIIMNCNFYIMLIEISYSFNFALKVTEPKFSHIFYYRIVF